MALGKLTDKWLVVGVVFFAAPAACAPAAPNSAVPDATREPLATIAAVRQTPRARIPTQTVDVAPPTPDVPVASPTADLGAAEVATATPDAGNAAELVDMIRVTDPQAGQIISSPLVIRGEARGTWFFEASFPVTLEDADGVELGHTIASALGDWMTEDFVPFEATLTFEVPPAAVAGRLILARDNPSGLPEHDAQLVVPVRLGR